MKPGTSALVGGLSVVPFAAANAIVGNRIEPFFSFIRPGPHTSGFEYVLLTVVMLCLPAGAFISAQPMFQRGAGGQRRVYVLNAVLTVVLLGLFVALSAGLGADIYRCDMLKLPNCD